jgi:serine/threonine-protein kinase
MSRTPLSGPESGPVPVTDRGTALAGGKYKLQAVIGSGGMGSVYEARNTWTKRKVAIKFLRPDLTATRESVLRFMQEAQAATAIAHPNIVQVLDMGRDPDDGSLYIVQEFLSGESLRARIQRGLVSVYEAVDLMLPIMGALCAAHSRGIVHRDLKPENIFLTEGPGGEIIPKLIDFGVSKVHGTGQITEKTETGQFMGTPRYMAPEQLRGSREVDGRADVWSICVVLYELVTGRCPYDSETLFSLVSAILNGRPVPPDQINLAVPAPFSAVLMPGLDPDLGTRYASMRDLVDAILGCQEAQHPTSSVQLAERHRLALQPVPPADDAGAEELQVPEELFTPVMSQPALQRLRGPGPGTAMPPQGGELPTVVLGASGRDGAVDGRSVKGEIGSGALVPARSRWRAWVGAGLVLGLAAAGFGARALRSSGSRTAPGAPPSAQAPASTPTLEQGPEAAAAPASPDMPAATVVGAADGNAGSSTSAGSTPDAGATSVPDRYRSGPGEASGSRPPVSPGARKKARRPSRGAPGKAHFGDTYLLDPD